MTDAKTNETTLDSLNRAGPNTLADLLRSIGLGDVLAGVPQTVRKFSMDGAGASPYNVATLDAMGLPANQRASVIHRAYARAGGVTGPLTIVARGTTPATGEIGVAPNGDIVTLGTDAITDLDVQYLPDGGEVVETVLPVASDSLALPAAFTAKGVVLLVECEAVEGTATGKKIVLIEGAGAPAAGACRLNAARTAVAFAAADAVTRARVKVVLAPVAADQLKAKLQAPASIY